MIIIKGVLIIVDTIITFPFTVLGFVLGFVFELIRLEFMYGRERYVKYLIWLVKEKRKI